MPVILPTIPPGSSTAMAHARQGLDSASRGLASAAERLAGGTAVALHAFADPSALVDLSPAALDLLDDIDDAIIDSKVAQHSYTANAAVVRAADEQAEQLVRIGQESD